jgi:tetratricopeptide (TPR) repeat protein
MKVIIGRVMKDTYTVKSQEPLPPGQEVFIVTKMDAEDVYYLAKTLAWRGEAEKAFQILKEFEEVILKKFRIPYSEAIISPLLRLGRVEEALEIAKRIEEDRDRDFAFICIAFYVFNMQSDLEKATEIINKVQDKERRAWGEFLLYLGWAKREGYI